MGDNSTVGRFLRDPLAFDLFSLAVAYTICLLFASSLFWVAYKMF